MKFPIVIIGTLVTMLASGANAIEPAASENDTETVLTSTNLRSRAADEPGESRNVGEKSIHKRVLELERVVSDLKAELRSKSTVVGHGAAFEVEEHGHRSLQTASQQRQLQQKVNELVRRLACISRGSGSHLLIFDGCNVQIRNGAGKTEAKNGKGNLIIGYNELGPFPPVDRVRTGSHNLVVGGAHAWTATAGIVAGFNHESTADLACVVGGESNAVNGHGSVIIGGHDNINAGFDAVVVGGESNQLKSASFYGAIVGGSKNQVDMSYGLVAGGKQNSAEAFGGPSSGGTHAVILGGTNNRVQNTGNLVLGGQENFLMPPLGSNIVLVGGIQNFASGPGTLDNDVFIAGTRFED